MKTQSAALWAAFLPLLPVLYFLSPPFFVWFCLATNTPLPGLFTVIYAPVTVLLNHFPLYEKILEWEFRLLGIDLGC